MEEMSDYHEALLQCANRYMDMQRGDGMSDLWSFTCELQRGCLDGAPVPKLCRWLGYVQGTLIAMGRTTVEAERNWTRPLFRPLDFPGEC